MRRSGVTLIFCCMALALAACADDTQKPGGGDDAGTRPLMDMANVPDTDTPEADTDIPPASDAGDDGGTTDPEDAGMVDDAGKDGGDDVGPTITCDGIQTGQTLDLDDGSEAGQLYADATFDGENVWVVYNRHPDATSQEEAIYVVRLGCDGSSDEPLRVSADDGLRKYYPAIAAGDETVFIVWVSEVSSAEKDIMYQGIADDGSLRLTTPADITPSGGVETVSNLIWELDVAALPGDRAVLVGAAGTFGEWQAVAQRFDSDGMREGNGFFPYTEKGVDQSKPTVTADDEGTIYMAWTRYKPADPAEGTPEEPDTVVFTSVPANAVEGTPSPPPPAKPLSGPNPIASLADEPGPNGEYFLAFQETSNTAWDILVRDGSDFQTAATTTFGTPQRNNFRPDVAGGSAGGAVAWYRFTTSPLKNDVVVNFFGVDAAGNVSKGAETDIPTTNPAIPPYGPRIVHITSRLYFITWAEGSTAPEARVKGRFVQL